MRDKNQTVPYPPKRKPSVNKGLFELGGNLATALAVKKKLKLEHLVDERHLQLKADAVVGNTRRVGILGKLSHGGAGQVRR